MRKILLVEDNVLILESTGELLEAMGYEVVPAANGSEALKGIKETAGKIDVVLLDLTLPDISGDELLPQLVAIQPDVKVIICSGVFPDEDIVNGHDSVQGFLPKPFDMRELGALLEKVIGGN